MDRKAAASIYFQYLLQSQLINSWPFLWNVRNLLVLSNHECHMWQKKRALHPAGKSSCGWEIAKIVADERWKCDVEFNKTFLNWYKKGCDPFSVDTDHHLTRSVLLKRLLVLCSNYHRMLLLVANLSAASQLDWPDVYICMVNVSFLLLSSRPINAVFFKSLVSNLNGHFHVT